MDEADAYPESFTAEFVSHCRASGLPPRLFGDLRAAIARMPRYIRLRPPYASELAPRGALAASLGLSPLSVTAVEWLPLCYAIPRDAAVRRAGAYERGAIAAMDVSSVAAVVALRPQRGEAVWDVCCAPGMKLGLIADAVGPNGVAVGTDIRLDRLFAARAVLRRQGVSNVCLFATDGTRFTPQRAALAAVGTDNAKRDGNGLTAHEARRLRKRGVTSTATVPAGSGGDEALIVFASDMARQSLARAAASTDTTDTVTVAAGFDRVLVDAECSHDGSLPHLFLDPATRRPFGAAESVGTARGVDNARRMRQLHLSRPGSDGNDKNCTDSLAALQLRLLQAGFAQLRPGGTLVYSTCSFAYAQNERVVRELLRGAGGEAVALHPFDFSRDATATATEVGAGDLSPAVGLTDAQAAALRDRLDAGGDPYGIVAAGDAAEGSAEFTGVRFWPSAFESSFQFVAKIWKKPQND